MKFHTNIILGVAVLTVTIDFSSADCVKSQCPGPLQYYKEIGCTPVYKNPGDCCAYKYNCDQLKNRNSDKCYVNDRIYKRGENLRKEDGWPCDICFCNHARTPATFTCAIVDCFHPEVPIGCYQPKNATQCCAGGIICPKKPEDRPTCMVDGQIYKDGEYFKPAAEPNKNCICGPGYTGENIEPFCIVPSRGMCRTELRHANDVQNNCSPVYTENSSPQNSCPISYRCQNDKDQIIKSSTNDDDSENLRCQFGNMKLRIGEELKRDTDKSNCQKCICEVPPTLTCKSIPENQCKL